MLFSEIYSAYYQAVSLLIEKAINDELNTKNINSLISDAAFLESFLYITEAINNEEWCVITKQYQTPIKKSPNRPLTHLERSFLKAICMDKRFALFAKMPSELENIEPLYTQSHFYVFDVFNDGDNYDDETYQLHFKTTLEALKDKKRLAISFIDRKGKIHEGNYSPLKLEFSAKDDRFRLLCHNTKQLCMINISRITQCQINGDVEKMDILSVERQKTQVEIEIKDYRNALERVLTTFANYKKETQRINDTTYILKITYNKEEETELLIRILAFGPMVKVLAPQAFLKKLCDRIQAQMKLHD